MANIRNLKEKNGSVFYPLTHERAVRDSNGVSLDTKLAGLESKSYAISWDGASTPVEANIPAGVVVTYNATTYTGTLNASASTVGKIYLVKNGNNYDQYITSQDGSSYSWTPLGSTALDLTGYATEEDLEQLSEEIEEMGGISVDDTDPESLSIGAPNGKNIVQFSEGHIKTKSFNSKDMQFYTEKEEDERFFIGAPNGKNIVQFSEGHIKTRFFDSSMVAKEISRLEEISRRQEIDDKTKRKLAVEEDYLSYKYGKYDSTWFERLRLMHFSDNHEDWANLEEAVELKDLVHLCVDTGDNANTWYNIDSSDLRNILSRYPETIGDTDLNLVICPGNHDVPGLTKKQYYDIMCGLVASKTPSFVFGDSSHYRTYGYIDVTPNSYVGTVRIITLDPFDYDDGLYLNPYGTRYNWMNCVFSQNQIDWLISTLRDAASNGYAVITAMHYSFGDNTVWGQESANPDALYHQDPFMIPDIIDAMQNKTPLSKNYSDDKDINNIVIDEDFTGINDFHYICHLFGHIHSENEYQCQKTNGSKFYDMLMVGAPSMGDEGFAINKVPKQEGTLNSIKLTILEIDTKEDAVYRVNYGAYKAYDGTVTERTKRIPCRFNI